MNVDNLLDKVTPTAALDFDAVVEEFYEALYQFAFSLSRSASDAADLTQETYRVFLLKAEQIRDPRKIKSWLFTTLYREFLKGRHRLSRFPEVELEEAADELPVVTPSEVDKMGGALVLAALESVEDKYRAPIALFYLDNLSYREIAEVLNLPIGTVMSRLSRGKLVLRQKLSAIFAAEATETLPATTQGHSWSKAT